MDISNDYLNNSFITDGKEAGSLEVHGARPGAQTALERPMESALVGIVAKISHDIELCPQLICAEPHMGRTTIATNVAMDKAARNVKVRLEELSHMLPQELMMRLTDVVRWSRKQRAAKERALVVLDNLSIGDEHDTGDIVQFLRRIVASGAMLLIVCEPEGEVLAQDFGEAHCYWSCDLAISSRNASWFDEGLMHATRGVPRLAQAYMQAFEPGDENTDEHIISDPGFLEAYTQVVSAMLRPEVMREERHLRSAMLLLGQGTLVDLERVMPRVDPDLWRTLARDVQVLGIDISNGSFCCACNQALAAILVVHPELEDATGEIPHVVSAAASLLAERGDLVRAAVVCRLCTDEDLKRAVVLRWAAQFLDIGEVDIVADVLETLDEESGGAEDDEARIARMLLASLDRVGSDARGGTKAQHLLRAKDLVPKDLQDAGECSLPMRRALLAVRARQLLGAKCTWDDVESAYVDDDMCRLLTAHCNAFALMAHGSFAEAYDVLANCPTHAAKRTLCSTLIEMDYLVCSLFMGTFAGRGQMRELQGAEVFLAYHGLEAFCDLVHTLPLVARTLCGRDGGGLAIEPCIQRADRAGDTFLRGVYYLAGAVLDMRMKAFMRAHVRLGKAMTDFTQTQARYLHNAAKLLDMAVRVHFGERVLQTDINACQGLSQDMDHVTTIVAAAASRQSKKPTGYRSWGSGSCPRSVFWLLNVLANDCGIFSLRFLDLMPAKWRESLTGLGAQVQNSYVEEAEPTRHQGRSSESSKRESPSEDAEAMPRLEIRLLGGFAVFVDGKQTVSSKLEQRRAKPLLTLLAALPGHTAKRFTIMETIWPEFDYEVANKRLYSATSVLRQALGLLIGYKTGSPPMVTARKGDASLTLNTRYISCDVDALEYKARLLLDCEGDNRMVTSLCRDIEELYKGDLVVPPTDATGIMQARATELRTLFADTMIAGSEAALNLGMRTLACRFARKAYDADSMREDSIRALVTALCAAGRHIEARRHYDQYVSRVVRYSRRPPSRRLREIVEELLKGVARTGDAKPAKEVRSSAAVEIVESHAVLPLGQLKLDLGGI